jgi:hypothetical protein
MKERNFVAPDGVLLGESSSDQISLLVRDIAITRWCLEVQLLRENLADSLALSDGQRSLLIRPLRGGGPRERSRLGLSDPMISVYLSETDLEFVSVFFLRYFRDSCSDVDHLDIQLDGSEGKVTAYFTLVVERYKSPASAEEARRCLGL